MLKPQKLVLIFLITIFSLDAPLAFFPEILQRKALAQSGPTSSKIYWTQSGTERRVRRANLDGSNVEDIITTITSTPFGLAVDPIGNKVYWTLEGDGQVRRANLDGDNINTVRHGF